MLWYIVRIVPVLYVPENFWQIREAFVRENANLIDQACNAAGAEGAAGEAKDEDFVAW